MEWLLLAAACLAFQTTQSGQFQRRITKTVGSKYLVSLPEGYSERTEDRFPVLLFLHGFGERGSDLEKLKVHGPLKEIAKGRRLPFIVVAPQLPETETTWNPDVLLALLDEIEARYRVDKSREYVSGISMGGYGTWAVAAAAPSRFAAMVPICGGGNFLSGYYLRDMPIWAIHGDADTAVPLSQSQVMIDGVKRFGGSPEFTIVKGGGHDVWTDIYSGDAIYDWLLRHKKAIRTSPP